MYVNCIKYYGTSFGRSTVTANIARTPKSRMLHSSKNLTDEKYKQVNAGFKKVEVVDTISKRIETLPVMMDEAFETTTDYISCKIPRNAFINKYHKTMVPLYKRIKNGYNSEEYSLSYKHEIAALNKITDISRKYVINQISGEQFDSDVERALSEYTSTELNRKKSFVI